MSITKILSEETTAPTAKLERVAEVVAAAREHYGNAETEIPSPTVPTTHGSMNFNYLDDDSKVAVLRGEVQKIKVTAVEYTEQNPGTNINRKIEELIATNGMFANIAAGTKFEYL